jgi:intracellular multiplication protein IcmJ
MSQAALICLVREMHSRLRAGGESFDGEPGPVAVSADRSALHYVRLALSNRVAVASELVGTTRPSELAQVLARMSRPFYDRRHKLLGGLRVLPIGRFFMGVDDVYPAIIDSWRQAPAPMPMPMPMPMPNTTRSAA